MSIREKINEMVENTRRAFAAGAASVPSMDSFWDVFQDYGNRTEYANAFRSGSKDGGGWNDDTFTPKYAPITVVGSANGMFENTQITEIDVDKVDFSKATTFGTLFRYSEGIKSVVMDVSSATDMTNTFRQAPNLRSIILAGLPANCKFTMAFYGCTALLDLQIFGTIGQNGFSVSNSSLLTAPTIRDHILYNLEDKSADTSGTQWVCTIGSFNLGKLTDGEKAMATEKGWTLA